MYETKPYFYGTGRRKDSVARVRVYTGTGKITINDRDIDNYFGLETLKLIVRSPLVLLGLEGKYDVVVRVSGGGVSGQAGAIRHGLSRALLQQNEENRAALKKEGFLTRDPRMKERKKYGLKTARCSPQFSNRGFYPYCKLCSSALAELLFYCKFSATALTGCWPSGISSSEQTKNAVKTALKAAVEQSEDSYNLVENKALSVKARAILEAYLKEVEAGYTDVFEPQNVTHIWPTDVTVGDDGFGTAVFSMPENAVDPQAWKNAANALVANFLCYYQYNGNNVEFCVEIVKQEAADGQGEAADYMVIFAKKHDGGAGGEIWTPPAL